MTELWSVDKIDAQIAEADASLLRASVVRNAMLQMKTDYVSDLLVSEQTIAERDATIAALNTENEQLRDNKLDLILEAESHIATIATLTARIGVLNSHLSARAAELIELTSQLTARNAEIADLETHIDSLERALYRAQNPADVYVTVDTTQSRVNQLQQGVAIITNEFIPATKAAAVAKMAPYVEALYDKVSYHVSTGFGVMDAWHWDGTGTRPAKPTNMTSLKSMTNLANQFKKPHLLTIYSPSWWMKRDRARPLTFAEMWGSHETGRLAGEHKANWKIMVEEMFIASATEILRVDPAAIIYAQVHNEFKGMWQLLDKDVVLKGQNWADGNNPGTPGYGDIDYGPYYALCVDGIKAGMGRLGIAEGRVKYGGPYAVMQSEYIRDADAVPVGHPLANRIWGSSGKQAPAAIERFIAYCKTNSLPLDFLVIDGGTRNKDMRYETDAFGQLTKVSDMTRFVRGLLDAAGLSTVPIWWAERYLTERPAPGTDNTLTEQARITPYQDSMARRSVVTVAGLCEMAWAGAGMAFQWGLRGEDADPALVRENGAYFRADGTPTALYDALAQFKAAFPVGCTMYPLAIEGDGVGGWGSDESILLFNKTADARTVCIGDTVYELTGDSVLVEARNSL
jgi:hypothetical protein